jgi:polyisoprenoid-binding protein YceI
LNACNVSILTHRRDGRGRRPGRPAACARAGYLFAALTCIGLAACAPRRAEAPAPGPATAPPRAAVPAGAREYQIDPEKSVVTLLVRRAGKLSNFGHAHVVTSANETGRVWFGSTPDLSGFEVRVPVGELVVDDPAARAAAGPEFAAKVPDDARAGTRHNMLGPDVLDVARYPEIVVSSVGSLADTAPATLHVRLLVRGAELEREVPVDARVTADAVTAKGTFTVQQSELGIKPFSIVGGAIAVADEVEIHFEMAAQAIGPRN